MATIGYYYLHENGSLHYKRDLDGAAAALRDSDFVCMFWAIDPTNRESAWTILVEALALGADAGRVQGLAARWACDDADAQVYAQRIGATLKMDGNAWCATPPGFVDMMESPYGFGATALESLAELAKALGLQAHKMWGASFASLLRARMVPA